MKERILRAEPGSEIFTPERCFILELSNSASDETVSIARARVEPGVTTALHRLNEVEERYVVLAGEGRMEAGDLPPTDVRPGDVVLVPAGARQRITNTGERDLVFLCVCTPPYFDGCYEDLEGGGE